MSDIGKSIEKMEISRVYLLVEWMLIGKRCVRDETMQ